MHPSRDLDSRRPLPRLRRGLRWRDGAIRPRRHRWRKPLLAMAALLLLALAVVQGSVLSPPWDVRQGTGAAADPRQVSGAVAPQLGQSALTSPSKSQANASAREAGSPLPPAATAAPSSVRPPAVAIMPRVASSGHAPVRKAGTPDPDPASNHVVVVDGESGAVLFQRQGYDPVAPASLTKIMTAILGIEYGTLTDHVKVDVDASAMVDSTVMGLEPWFDVTLEDLLYGLMLPSGNDAALAIGRYVAGSDEAFVRLMNEKAAWLGLQSTHFANSHGLDDPAHYSSPYDMVVMARYGMQYPEFRKLAAARRYDIARSNIAYTIYNLNPILNSYPGADGVKIGYTDNAGRSMVATAVKNGHRVYVAFMGSEAGLVPETSELLDWAFDSFTWP